MNQNSAPVATLVVGADRRPRAHSDVFHSFSSLLGDAPAFRSTISRARAAGSDVSVLIEGETGTGKELIAQAIHLASTRAAKPFVAVNCGAMSRDLATTEFFGYEGGAFTGALREGRGGKFEQANGGTLFLDEIGDLALELQAVLLRVLEDQRVVRVGGQRSIPVSVRVIAATNHDLLAATERGTFRRDLYYRLSVLKISMPPLRERLDDLEMLFEHYCAKAYHRASLPVPHVDPEVFRVLRAHPWHGNIRELRNLVERLAIEVQTGVVRPEDLPPEYLRRQRVPLSPGLADSTTLRAQELGTIQSTLLECTGNVTEAARKLGINRSTIYRKLGRVAVAAR